MDMILRAAAIYAFVWLVLRISGKRTMSEMTAFDFVLLLIFGEATQQAILGDDFSLTNAAVVLTTLVMLDRMFAIVHFRWPKLERLMEGRPVLLVHDGTPLKDAMARERVDEEDILGEARRSRGLVSMDEIRHVILEPSGGLSIIPRERPGSA